MIFKLFNQSFLLFLLFYLKVRRAHESAHAFCRVCATFDYFGPYRPYRLALRIVGPRVEADAQSVFNFEQPHVNKRSVVFCVFSLHLKVFDDSKTSIDQLQQRDGRRVDDGRPLTDPLRRHYRHFSVRHEHSIRHDVFVPFPTNDARIKF